MLQIMGSRQTEREEEIKEEYLKTLQDLTVNNKILIDVLTEVADENREYASSIVECIEEQIENVSTPLCSCMSVKGPFCCLKMVATFWET